MKNGGSTGQAAAGMRKRGRQEAPAQDEASRLAELHTRAGFLFRRAGQLVANVAEQETAKMGLTAPQHVCLIAISRSSALDQISLGKALGMDRATIGELIRRLEARGLVERASDPRDARRKIVALTPAGRELVPAAEAVSQRVSDYVLAGLEPRERDQLVLLLTKAVGALNAGSVTPIELPDRAQDV